MKFSQFIENSELSFHSPITQEEWDRITDVELEKTEEITFKTPSEKEVSFRKIKHGKWIKNDNNTYSCSVCNSWIPNEQYYYARYCLYCGADMRGEENE